MQFIWDGTRQAVHLILGRDRDIVVIVETTLRVALWSTLLALAIGLPLGLALGLGRFRGRRLALGLANAGMGLPPVVVGLVVSLLLFRGAPLGGLGLLYTLDGVIVAQTVLALPVVAMGSAFAEVGAVVLVGGNIQGETQTLASAVLVRVSAGEYGRAIALGTILLGLILVLAAGLTLAQQHERRGLVRRPS